MSAVVKSTMKQSHNLVCHVLVLMRDVLSISYFMTFDCTLLLSGLYTLSPYRNLPFCVSASLDWPEA